MLLPEQTEEGAPRNEGDQGQTVTQSVQGPHHHVENQLQTQADKDQRTSPHTFLLT